MKYLTRRGGGIWTVQLQVPASARNRGPFGRGKTVERSTGTTDAREAEARAFRIVAELHAAFAEAAKLPAPLVGAARFPDAARSLVALEAAGEIDSEQAWDAYGARVDSHLAQFPLDPEGDPKLPAEDVALIRTGFSILSGAADRMHDRLADQFVAHLAAGRIKVSTVDMRKRHLERFRAWVGHDYEPVTITKAKAAQYVTNVLQPWEVGIETKRLVLQTLAQFWTWCEAHELTKANPWPIVGNLLRDIGAATEDEERRPWTPDEVLKVLQVIPQSDPCWSLLALLAGTGARREEVCCIEVDDVDLLEWTITVRVSKTAAGRGRVVPIVEWLQPLVAQLVATSSDGFLLPGLTYTGKDKKRGTLVGKRLLDHFVRKKAGIADREVVVHGLRHSVITQMVAANIPKAVRAQIVGHEVGEDVEALHYTGEMPLTQKRDAIAVITYGARVDELVRLAGPSVRITRQTIRRARA